MPTNEKNEVRMFGVLPSQGADPIPVSLDAYGADPLSVPPSAFKPTVDTDDWSDGGVYLINRVALAEQNYYAPIYFPDKVTVTALTLYGYRDLAAAAMSLALYRMDRIGGATLMASVIANWIGGYSHLSDSTITAPIIDNVNYQYVLYLSLDPSIAVLEVRFSGATITFS